MNNSDMVDLSNSAITISRNKDLKFQCCNENVALAISLLYAFKFLQTNKKKVL